MDASRPAVLLACALALALQARFGEDQARSSRQPGQDPVGNWEAALARLPPLPRTATVGFVTNVDVDQSDARLFLTRYALAPRLVVEGYAAPFVLGHFRSAADADAAARAAGLSVLAGTDDGLFLLARPR